MAEEGMRHNEETLAVLFCNWHIVKMSGVYPEALLSADAHQSDCRPPTKTFAPPPCHSDPPSPDALPRATAHSQRLTIYLHLSLPLLS